VPEFRHYITSIWFCNNTCAVLHAEPLQCFPTPVPATATATLLAVQDHVWYWEAMRHTGSCRDCCPHRNNTRVYTELCIFAFKHLRPHVHQVHRHCKQECQEKSRAKLHQFWSQRGPCKTVLHSITCKSRCSILRRSRYIPHQHVVPQCSNPKLQRHHKYRKFHTAVSPQLQLSNSHSDPGLRQLHTVIIMFPDPAVASTATSHTSDARGQRNQGERGK
jgi:hypothetical protein